MLLAVLSNIGLQIWEEFCDVRIGLGIVKLRITFLPSESRHSQYLGPPLLLPGQAQLSLITSTQPVHMRSIQALIVVANCALYRDPESFQFASHEFVPSCKNTLNTAQHRRCTSFTVIELDQVPRKTAHAAVAANFSPWLEFEEYRIIPTKNDTQFHSF